MELAELSPEDRKAFMEDLGVVGFSTGETLRKIFTGMGASPVVRQCIT